MVNTYYYKLKRFVGTDAERFKRRKMKIALPRKTRIVYARKTEEGYRTRKLISDLKCSVFTNSIFLYEKM